MNSWTMYILMHHSTDHFTSLYIHWSLYPVVVISLFVIYSDFHQIIVQRFQCFKDCPHLPSCSSLAVRSKVMIARVRELQNQNEKSKTGPTCTCCVYLWSLDAKLIQSRSSSWILICIAWVAGSSADFSLWSGAMLCSRKIFATLPVFALAKLLRNFECKRSSTTWPKHDPNRVYK